MRRVLAGTTTLALSAALITLVAPAAHASTLRVPGSYRTIGAAISAAHNGDTVLVSPGTYRENLSIVGKYITVRAASSDPKLTVIAGNPGRTPVMIQNVPRVGGTILQGFRIISGSAPAGQGGGITIANGASPTIIYNQILSNRAVDGGGILIYNGSNPHIAYNTIASNTASSYGGGVFAYINSSPTLHHNNITANHANGGGGIYLESNSGNRAAHAGGVVTLNTITNNVGSGAGGGIMLRTGEVAQITRNTITGNSAPYGGGIHIETNGSAPLIARNMIKGNTAATSAAEPGSGSGGGISVFGQSAPTIQANTLLSNRSSVYGGGLVLAEGSNSQVVGNNIALNAVTGTAASDSGGGIFLANSNANIWNNIVRSNGARSGAGLAFSGTGSWVVFNNTVVANKVNGGYGGGLLLSRKTSGKTSIYNNIVADNTNYQIFDAGRFATWDNNLVNGANSGAFFSYGTHGLRSITSINGNPNVVRGSANIEGNLGFASESGANYTLLSNSAAIDRGRSLGAAHNDFSGATRPKGRTYDIGAYEYRG
jgi:hypothetical protein